MTIERLKEILVGYIDKDLNESEVEWVREVLADLCTQDELKELGLWEWLQFDYQYLITATCFCCGRVEEYLMSDEEYKNLEKYYEYGRNAGKLQDLFPKMPAWIRASLCRESDGFCICPECN